MNVIRPRRSLTSHRVTNQVPPFEGMDLYASDPLLARFVEAGNAAAQQARVAEFAAQLSTPETWELGRLANRNPPQLRRFDHCGQRIDEVEFHPAYHQLMTLAFEAGTAGAAWTEPSGGHQLHAALEYLLCQVEAGVCCPVTMSYAAAPVLAGVPGLDAVRELLLQPAYDPSSQPMEAKTALTMGMAMTEKQGGSDLRAGTTKAQPIGGDNYLLTGHKWFCSAPMSDAFLALAQAPGGLTCFFLPRWRPDGERNELEFQRLKDKLGNRSNASAELELHGAWAQRIGDEGAGVRTIIEMVHHTRLDCSIAAAGLMRQAFVRAVHHARHRRAFGCRLIEHDLMARVLADLAVEVEATALMSFRAAELCDAAAADPALQPLARLAVAVAKYWANKRCPIVVVEAMECLGGAGYIEDSLLPRLYREAPLNGIWEGSGNVICLDILRTMQRQPAALELFTDELGDSSTRVLNGLDQLGPGDARQLAGGLARAWQGSLLARRSAPEVGAAFAHRVAGGAFGEAISAAQAPVLIERLCPELGQ